MNAPKLLLPALLVLMNTGCAELEPYLPTVNFKTLDPQDISFEGADIDFVFNVRNPNPINIGLSSFSYDLDLADTPLFAGDNEDGFELEAVGDSELRLPVSLTWQGVYDTITATRGIDTVPFGLKGDFGFDTPIGEALLPYDEGGDFPAVRTPKFRFQKVRVRNVDLFTQTAKIDVDLGVTNEHASSLIFENFDYNVKLGGTSVATGKIAELGEVLGAEEGTLTLPINVNLLSVGTEVYQAITGNGTMNMKLNASSDVDTPFGLLPLSVDETGNVTVE